MCRSLKLFGLHYYGDFRMIFTVFIFFRKGLIRRSRFHSPEQIINRRIASLFVFVKASGFFCPIGSRFTRARKKGRTFAGTAPAGGNRRRSKEDTFVSVLEVLHSKNKNDKV
jgi:hypothetical protein